MLRWEALSLATPSSSLWEALSLATPSSSLIILYRPKRGMPAPSTFYPIKRRVWLSNGVRTESEGIRIQSEDLSKILLFIRRSCPLWCCRESETSPKPVRVSQNTKFLCGPHCPSWRPIPAAKSPPSQSVSVLPAARNFIIGRGHGVRIS